LRGSYWRSPFDDAACVCGATHALPQRVGRGPDPHTGAKNVFARAYFFSEIKGSGLLLTESIRAHFGKNTWFTFSRPPPPPNAKLMGFLLGRIFPHLAGTQLCISGRGGGERVIQAGAPYTGSVFSRRSRFSFPKRTRAKPLQGHLLEQVCFKGFLGPQGSPLHARAHNPNTCNAHSHTLARIPAGCHHSRSSHELSLTLL